MVKELDGFTATGRVIGHVAKQTIMLDFSFHWTLAEGEPRPWCRSRVARLVLGQGKEWWY